MTEMMKQDRASFMEGFFKSFFGVGVISRPVSNEVLRDAWRQAMMAGLRPTLAAADAFAHTDFRPDLASFTVPTLVIHGTADDTVPIEATSKVVAERVPGARLIEYEGSPHGIFATDKEEFARDLVDFLGEGLDDDAERRSAIPMGETAY
jgi:pimeloyl-ACP methyl ester carboxylesterase